MEQPPVSAFVAHSLSGSRSSSRSAPVSLPLPGSPSSSWGMYKARLRAVFAGANPRVCIAFWLFGEAPLF